MATFKAFIFDLDGVIVDTAKYHYLAWKRLANELGFDLTLENNEKLKGVSREESLAAILKWGKINADDHQKEQWAEKKNQWYLEAISNMGRDEILPGVEEFLQHAQQRLVRLAIASSSRNTMMILHQLNLLHYFEFIADGNMVTKSKPNPQIFEIAAQHLRLPPKDCVVFEDAPMGIDAANSAGMFTVGVGKPENLTRANLVIADFEFLTYSEIVDMIKSFGD